MIFYDYKKKWYPALCVFIFGCGPFLYFLYEMPPDRNLGFVIFVISLFYLNLWVIPEYLFLFFAPLRINKVIQSELYSRLIALAATILSNVAFFYFVDRAITTNQPTGMEGIAYLFYLPLKILFYVFFCAVFYVIGYMRDPVKVDGAEQWEIIKYTSAHEEEK